MKCVTVGDLVIGEGLPKIAVPITERTEEAVVLAAAAAADSGDLIEFRADCFEGAADPDRLTALLRRIREVSSRPVLFTLRTAREGGALACSDSLYKTILLTAAGSGQVDLMDVELAAEGAEDLIRRIHEAGLWALVSQHDFTKTPENENILRDLALMEAMGADVVKGAYMPRQGEDVPRLLALAREAAERLGVPFILISMGQAGKLSRVEGERYGSALTFASLSGRESAPGQIDALAMRALLREAHERLLMESAS